MIKKVLISLWLLVLVFATSWSLLRPGFFRVHDYVHAARVAEITRAMAEGHFPVRWSANFGYGYGMPLFEFYAPLPYYLGAFFFWLGLDIVLVLKLLWMLTSVFTIWGAYRLGKEMYGRSGGVVTAALFGLAPYRALNLYVRGALSEAWGMMAMPWILLGIILTLRQKRWGWLVLVAGLVTLFLSHNLTTLIFVPLSVVFALCWWLITERKLSRWPKLLPVAGSYVLSIGLAAFYLFPAFLEKDFTKVSQITGGYFDYNLHFLYIRQLITPGWGYGGSSWGPADDISFFVGFGQVLGILFLAVILLLLFYKSIKFQGWSRTLRTLVSHKKVQLTGIFFILAGVAAFMSLLKSQIIWQTVPLLSFIQFPWRWLSAGILFLCLGVAAFVWFIRIKAMRVGVAWLLVAITLSIHWWYFQPQTFLNDPSDLYYTDSDRIQVHMSQILNDYVPVQMPPLNEIKPPTQAVILSPPEGEERLTTLLNHGHEKLFATNFNAPTQMTLAIANFPGWQAEIDGQQVAVTTSPSGLVTLEVPAGGHLVSVYFGATPVRQLSDTVSAVSLVGLMFLIWPRSVTKEKSHA